MNSTQILFDRTSTANTEYIGFAGSGIATSTAQWKIMQVVYDANSKPTSIKYAGGTQDATSKWDDRTTLAYS